MNDVMLYARLKDLAMPAPQAWALTAQIRDTLHPIAHTAAVKIYNAVSPQSATRGMGAVSTQSEISAGSAVAGAAAGAAYGSVVPGIGTAVGAVVGLVASMLVHGAVDPTHTVSRAIVAGLASIPSSFVGRTIPWTAPAPSAGLLQIISSLMTLAEYMAWDTSMGKPSIAGNWATTFQNAVIALTNAIINNPVNASVTVSIAESPGAGGIAPLQFVFTNPGIGIGPDAIAANLIMGTNGLMYKMIKQLGETDAHAAANASNAAAEKVFALMVDHATADALPPASLSAQLANAPITQVPAAIAVAAQSVATAALNAGTVPAISTAPGGPAVAQITTPVPLNTGSGAGGAETTTAAQVTAPATAALSPVQDTTAALLQQLIAQQGANLTSPAATQLLADVAANGVQATPAGPSSLPDWVLPVGLAAAALVAVVLLAKH